MWTNYRPIIMVDLLYYNQSGVTEMLIMTEPHYGQMCFMPVKTFEAPILSRRNNKIRRFVDPNERGAQRRVYSDLRIYCN